MLSTDQILISDEEEEDKGRASKDGEKKEEGEKEGVS